MNLILFDILELRMPKYSGFESFCHVKGRKDFRLCGLLFSFFILSIAFNNRAL